MKQLSERWNLRKLLKEVNRIEIPMLQRDYAQGRRSQEGVARAFLDSIFETLDGKKETLHIDFVFGYKEKEKFILLDGQQRITTLWLLHFYIYKMADRLEEIKDLLSKFSYNVRPSSAKFCKNLLKKAENLDGDLMPSKAIRAQGGEFENAENLKNDPTIKAMLHMLDLIFEKMQSRKIEPLFNNLDKITFNLFDMEEYSLGEELYIKMNARGKQLSKYENLKAFIEKNIDVSKNINLLKSIDIHWSDYFFKSSEKFNEGLFDVRGNNFLHYATLFFMLENDGVDTKDIKEIVDNVNRPVNDFYKPLQEMRNLEVLDRVIYLCIGDLRINEPLRLRDSAFFDGKEGKLKYLDICYFFSILSFCKRNREIKNINERSLNDYLKVCRHFIENHLLDSVEHLISFFKLFEHLAEGHQDIYKFLAEKPTYSFHSNIYLLEVRKAKLILISREGGPNWEEILNQTSKHEVLKGWVDFLFDFSGQESANEICSEYDSVENVNLEKFQQYARLTMEILNKEQFLDKHLTLFQRALLCMGDYGFYSTNYFYGNVPFDFFRDREALIWILRGNKNSSKSPYFKKLLDNLLNSGSKDLTEKMKEIINQTNLLQKKWHEQLLIRQEELFDFLNKKREVFQRYRRIRYFESINKVELLPGTRNIVGVRDLLDYAFYCYCKKKRLELSEYDDTHDQYGDRYELSSHFLLQNQRVLCDSTKSIIEIGDKQYPIDLREGSDILAEFDRILREIDKNAIGK